MVQLDYSARCHGFWLPTVTIGEQTFDADLLRDDWRPGSTWGVDNMFKGAIELRRTAERQHLSFPAGSKVNWVHAGVDATGVVLGAECDFIRVRPDATSRIDLVAVNALPDLATESLLVFKSQAYMVTLHIARPYRHADCMGFCVNTQKNVKRANLMCILCESVPRQGTSRHASRRVR